MSHDCWANRNHLQTSLLAEMKRCRIPEILLSECEPNTGEAGGLNAGQRKDANGTSETAAEVTYRLHQGSDRTMKRDSGMC